MRSAAGEKFPLRTLWLMALMGALALAPFLLTGYRLRLLTTVFMWIGLAGSWNLITGYTGYIDFGPAAYYGIGAYTTGILMAKGGLPFFPSVLLGGLFASLVALPVGIPTLRLRGAYFAIATLAFAEAMKQLTLEWDGLTGLRLTGGSHGLILPLSQSYNLFYYAMLVIMFLVLLTTWWVERSKFGYGLKAIREREEAAMAMGVNALRLKLGAYLLSAFFLGLIGGTAAYWLTYINPNDVFTLMITIQMVVMVLLGGLGTLLGPVLGATFLTLVSEVLWAQFIYTYLIILGVIIVFIVIFMPRGIMSIFTEGGRP